MRGRFTDQGGLFSYIAPDKRVPANHPLRKVRELVRDVLSDLNRSLGRLYASEGRPSIPPEQLLSALLLQVFYGIRSVPKLRKRPSTSELIDWICALRKAGVDLRSIGNGIPFLGTLLKTEQDFAIVAKRGIA